MNLDRLRTIAERRFQAFRAGSTTGAPEWRYMSDQERRAVKHPAPTVVTPALVKQLHDLKSAQSSKLDAAIKKVRSKT